MIERCIFIICLDKRVTKYTKNDITVNKILNESKRESETNNEFSKKDLMENTAHQMLHGCGSKYNSGNRWFDKTMQFIISEDGSYGINFEHSPAEGIVVIELSEHLFRYM
jgi:hypothetical protein